MTPSLETGLIWPPPHHCYLEEKVRAQRKLIVAEFAKRHQVLEEEEQLLVCRLEQEEEETLQKLRENAAFLVEQSSSLAQLITEIEQKCQQPATDLLKDVKSTLIRSHSVKLQEPEAVHTELQDSYEVPRVIETLQKYGGLGYTCDLQSNKATQSAVPQSLSTLARHVQRCVSAATALLLKQAIIKALGPMMSILLHKKEPQNQIFKEISWLLEQYKEEIDVFHIIKSLSQVLEVSGEYKIPLPQGKFQAICSALHNQICSPAKQLSTENHKELVHCVLLLVPETRVKKLLIVKAVKSTLSDQNATVRKAALHFIRTLLSSGSVENCAAWDLVAYVFSEFSASTSKLDVEEESTIQTLCIDILQCLDTSVNGMTQVVASSPYEREGHGCAALQLLKALHQNIHAAVGEMWGVKIPSLLQYIEERGNSGELKLTF
ncbi:HEAT repeat-containing protein 7B2 [Chelonia mydas]|uniref:HEAT repeat-containing protein 7B2 n=1 Tax=Chelonia mydas TaxID=8469 RepID=M7BFD6_CHEMY|nr:HEAT repeat-containing protein 7B2 [Chelonia mydas]